MTADDVDDVARSESAAGAAFFDVDRTLLSGASALHMVRPFQQHGLITRRQTLQAGVAQIAYTLRGADDASIERSYAAVEVLVKGWDVAQLTRVVEEELETRLRPTVFREALDRVDMHHRAGQRVYAVSATMSQVIDPLARMLELDGYIATEMEQDDEGKLTGKVAKACHGEVKAERVREFAAANGIDLGASSAYSDSISDEHMLRAVGRPYAVNPDRELRKLAETEGWGILFFRRRTKLPIHRRRITHVLGALALAALAVGTGAARRRRG
jgi:HAD superfamily hydrolase (TIGR01490 family)